MKKKKLLIVMAGVLVLAVGIGIGAYAASNYGTQDDPLVAKSYLDEVLTPQLKQEFQSQVDQSVGVMEQEIDAAASISGGNFASVSLGSGQTLLGEAGCEIILRSGSAKSVGSGTMVDATDGVSLAAGTVISQNHLLTCAANGDGVAASSATTLLVLGSYSIK